MELAFPLETVSESLSDKVTAFLSETETQAESARREELESESGTALELIQANSSNSPSRPSRLCRLLP